MEMEKEMDFDYSLQPGRVRSENRADESAAPLISIVTGFYNAGRYFEQTFNSVMAQTFPWFEWLIVDDGSTDERDIELLYKLARTDPRVSVISQENKGISHARNAAVQRASAQIIVPLDADDLIAPPYLEYIFWGLYQDPDAAWCYTWSVGFGAQEYLWKVPWDAQRLKTYNFLTVTAGIRKKDILDIGGYPVSEHAHYEDWLFWLKMLEKKKRPAALGGYLFWYRRLDLSRSSVVKKHPEQERSAEEMVRRAARQADGTIRAREYPLEETRDPYHSPRLLDLGAAYTVSSGRTHLLMIIPWMTVGGADKFNLDLVRKIDKERFDVSIMTTVQSENEWHQRFERYTDKIFALPEFLDPAHYLDFVGYYIKAKCVDVVLISNSYSGYHMIPWIRKNFPQIGILDYVHMEEWYWRAGGYARVSGVMGAFIDRTCVCNSVTARVMTDTFGRKEDSVRTVHIGGDADVFDRKTVASGYLYHQYDIPPSRKIILFPCRIHPQKRPFMMLDIAQEVWSRDKDALFVVVGDGSQLDELKAVVRSRGLCDAVLFTGYLDDMKRCYRDARLTLICSLKEGLALTAYESCAMGVPVISSDVGGQRDLIDDTVGALIATAQKEEDGLGIRTYDVKEVMAFADAIQDLLTDRERYRACSRNCRRKIEEQFSSERMIQAMESEILRSIHDPLLVGRHREQHREMDSYGGVAEEIYLMQYMQDDMAGKLNRLNGAQAELAAIKTMRLWPLLEAYRHFVSSNKVGKRIYAVLKKWFGRNGTDDRKDRQTMC